MAFGDPDRLPDDARPGTQAKVIPGGQGNGPMQIRAYHHEKEAIIPAPQSEVFAYLDDQTRLAAHMEKRSMMMLGGPMTYAFDAAQGRAVGSVIQMGGHFLGLSLFVEEVVTERTPPAHKIWETRGRQRLLIIDSYVMGFETRDVAGRTSTRIYIDYQLPSSLPGRWFGLLFAGVYARWCVSQMLDDTSRNFRLVAKPQATT